VLVGLVVHHSALGDVARNVKSPVGRSCEESVQCEEPVAGRRSRRARREPRPGGLRRRERPPWSVGGRGRRMRRGGVGDLGRYVGRGPAGVRRGGAGVGTGPGGGVGPASGHLTASEEEQSALQANTRAPLYLYSGRFLGAVPDPAAPTNAFVGAVLDLAVPTNIFNFI